jgi:hypothetical protein
MEPVPAHQCRAPVPGSVPPQIFSLPGVRFRGEGTSPGLGLKKPESAPGLSRSQIANRPKEPGTILRFSFIWLHISN